MNDLKLHTASWGAVMRYAKQHTRTCDGCGQEVPTELPFQPVRASVGQPRFWALGKTFPVARHVTPYGLRKLTGAEFRNAYLDRLFAAGVSAIHGELYEIAAGHDHKPLVLLCFEADPSECHRGQFAEWWQQQTGGLVTELDLATSTTTA